MSLSALLIGYGLLTAYAALAGLWSRLVEPGPGELPPPPEPPKSAEPMPEVPVLPDHPHSNLGWERGDDGHIGISCRASDPELLAMLSPGAEHGEYYCSDCKDVLRGYFEDAEKVATVNGRAAHAYQVALEEWKALGRTERKRRSPWLWPVWLLADPVVRLAPGRRRGRPQRSA